MVVCVYEITKFVYRIYPLMFFSFSFLSSFRYRLRHRCMKMVAQELMFTFFSVHKTIVVVLLLRGKNITQLQLLQDVHYRMLTKIHHDSELHTLCASMFEKLFKSF